MNILTLLAIIFLYAYGGADNTSKAWRRIGVPLVISLYLWNLLGLLMVIPLMIGYGETSWLCKLCKSNILTRLVIGTIMAIILCLLKLSLLPLLFIAWYVLWTAILKIDDYEIKGLLVEELLVGLGIGILTIL